MKISGLKSWVSAHKRATVLVLVLLLLAGAGASVLAYASGVYARYREGAVDIVARPAPDPAREPVQDGTDPSPSVGPEPVEELPDEPEEPVEDQPIYEEERKLPEVVNILLVGMDARNYETRSRSDTIVLLSYDTGTHTARLVSFMRDSWVKLSERGWQRINAATAYGGIGSLVNTVNENFGLDVQDYVMIKFDDFAAVVDLLGGVDVELTKAEIRYINNKQHADDGRYDNDVTAQPGVVHLNGRQALWHCRNRSVGNSDFSRTERQREMLELLVRQNLDRTPLEIVQLIDAMSHHVSMNLDLDLLAELAMDVLAHRDELMVESYSLPFDGMYRHANKNGASVLELDIGANTEELHRLLGYADKEALDAEDDAEADHTGG